MRRILAFLLVSSLAFGGILKLTNGVSLEGEAVVHPGYVEIACEKGVKQFRKNQVESLDGKPVELDKNPIARISTSKGDMLVELYEDEAPNTVANFICLAEQGFFKGIYFHRVITKFMAQGGCPNAKEGSFREPGTGGPGYAIADEFSPRLKHDSRGILSMANSGPNSGGSQFFICFEPCPWLDGKHAVFGKVVEGLDTLDRIEGVATDDGKPKAMVFFNVEIYSKREHPYEVKKLDGK